MTVIKNFLYDMWNRDPGKLPIYPCDDLDRLEDRVPLYFLFVAIPVEFFFFYEVSFGWFVQHRVILRERQANFLRGH